MSDLSNDPDQIEAIVQALPVLIRLLRGSVAEYGVTEITFAQTKVLVHCYHHGRGTIGEIAAGIGVSLASASELIDRLADDGWAERSVNPADRRQVLVDLTPRARDVANRIHHQRRGQVSAAMRELSAEGVTHFITGLQALIDTLSEEQGAVSGPRRSRKDIHA